MTYDHKVTVSAWVVVLLILCVQPAWSASARFRSRLLNRIKLGRWKATL